MEGFHCDDIQYSKNRRDKFGELRKWSYQARERPKEKFSMPLWQKLANVKNRWTSTTAEISVNFLWHFLSFAVAGVLYAGARHRLLQEAHQANQATQAKQTQQALWHLERTSGRLCQREWRETVAAAQSGAQNVILAWRRRHHLRPIIIDVNPHLCLLSHNLLICFHIVTFGWVQDAEVLA